MESLYILSIFNKLFQFIVEAMKHPSALLLAVFLGIVAAEQYHVILDPSEKFNVSWSFEDTTPSSYITFTVSSLTNSTITDIDNLMS